LDGAPKPTQVDKKSYDRNRRNMAHHIGMDFLFTQREFCQSIQIDSEGRKVLVNSTRNGELLSVRAVPDHLAEKPWFKRKLRFPRQYLGITKMEERVKKLCYLVHVLTQRGIPTRAVLKSLKRLCLTWMFSKYEDMRKHVSSITRKLMVSGGTIRNPWVSRKDLPQNPCFHGEKIHANGLIAPLWSRSPPVRRDLAH